ncbi:DUF6086 family protein [Actinacidiphila acididurans]|uniref:Uncharacterized protein n=1 Tax=Actinacidiphila acididurans TaxID=2784346 RepID=A0ABS2TQX9_9ACTN|nr:DUF6086 family protein [Actinacidiphila acididurans]MBM9504368.1 hypothetical protein [Actinacidiphila acididurans]
MSQYFELGEQTLWNPSNGAARLFLRQVSVFEAELGLPSGIGPMRNDDCQIDPAALKTFVDALLRQYFLTSHRILIALSEGFIATVLVLAERAGVEAGWPTDSDAPEDDRRDVQVPADASDGTAGAHLRLGRLRVMSHELSRFMGR